MARFRPPKPLIILDPELTDVGMSGRGRIYLNIRFLAGQQTGLRLWWVGHECAHHVVGQDELAADCWSVRMGRDEVWFPPEMFFWCGRCSRIIKAIGSMPRAPSGFAT